MTTFKRRSKHGKITIIQKIIDRNNKALKADIQSGKVDGITRATMRRSFEIYKKGQPGLLEKWGIIRNRKKHVNPF